MQAALPPVAPRADESTAPPAAGNGTDRRVDRASPTTVAPTPEPRGSDAAPPISVQVRDLDAWFGAQHAVRGVSLAFAEHRVGAIIGPSGCGKSTFLRCLNRMHETVPGARVSGTVHLDGLSVYETDPILVRRQVGMVFQRPTPFPTMSIRDNVIAGVRVRGRGAVPRASLAEIVERSLRRAALWDEVKDRLRASALGLSGGQQQRLCIARALATEPSVLLLDEPTASLDPASTQRVEDLVYELRGSVTIIIVTHNLQQAARVSDTTAFMLAGTLVEAGATSTMFTRPRDTRTEDYITGRFG